MIVSRFEMPKRVVKDDSTATELYARFDAEPFESGYGRTIGNPLRRVLLSSLEGAAITAVKIAGVESEYGELDGVVEDVTEVILNLKQVLLRMNVRETATYKVKSSSSVLTAADIDLGEDGEVLNPELVIATLKDGAKLDMEIEVQVGRGFSPADWSQVGKDGFLPIDAAFSPVQRVDFSVENARVGSRTDYDKLVLDIWTDGRITPDEALTRASAVLRHHLDVLAGSDDAVIFEETENEEDEQKDEMRRILNMSVNEIELSVRAANCLNNANITTVGELAGKSEADMLKYRNFGKKSLNEIKKKLEEFGLGLGMQIDPGLLDD